VAFFKDDARSNQHAVAISLQIDAIPGRYLVLKNAVCVTNL
jgi:hypothetical protein